MAGDLLPPDDHVRGGGGGVDPPVERHVGAQLPVLRGEVDPPVRPDNDQTCKRCSSILSYHSNALIGDMLRVSTSLPVSCDRNVAEPTNLLAGGLWNLKLFHRLLVQSLILKSQSSTLK